MTTFCPPDLEETIPFLAYSINGLSIFGSIMVLMTYILIPKIRENWLMRNLVYLNLSNLCFGASSMFVYYEHFHQLISPQAILPQVVIWLYFCFKYSAIIWPLILAINLYQIIAKHNDNLPRFELLWVFIGFVIPIIIVITLKSFELIQFQQNLTFTIIEFIIPTFLLVFFTLLTYIKFINTAQLVFGKEVAKKMMKTILPYSFTTIVISIPSCAFSILFSIDHCFTLLSSVFLLIRFLQGAIDAIICSFNPTVREEMRRYFRKSDERINLTVLSMNSIL